MALLLLGVLLWSATHLIRGVAPGGREALIARFGEGPYKGLFSLALIASVVLMVTGWRSATPTVVYYLPLWGQSVALVLMFVALVLFAASGVPTNLKRYLRHPQLTGVAVWALAHLLANGDQRSVVLFGGIGLWALLEMPLISRREGEWKKPSPLPWSAELKPLVGGVVAYIVLLLLHPYLFGVTPL